MLRFEANLAGRGRAAVDVADGVIRRVQVLGEEDPGGSYVSPGFIDIQLNGFAGVDFSSAELEPEEVASILPAIWRTGVTSFCPTLVTNSLENLSRNLRVLEESRRASKAFAAAVPCYHLEGPWIAPGNARGVHDPRWMRPPAWEDFIRLQSAAGGLIGIVTLAPEVPGALEFASLLKAAGVIVAIGHTEASPEVVHRAGDAGATLATHLGNGCPQVLDRHENPLWAQLTDDRFFASIICDGYHLPADVVRTIVRAKGIHRCILITDATHVATLNPGRYRLGSVAIDLLPSGKVIRADGGCLGGSAIGMDRAVSRFMVLAGTSLASALEAATLNPARLLERRLCAVPLPGEPADLILFRSHPGGLHIERTYTGGAETYAAA